VPTCTRLCHPRPWSWQVQRGLANSRQWFLGFACGWRGNRAWSLQKQHSVCRPRSLEGRSGVQVGRTATLELSKLARDRRAPSSGWVRESRGQPSPSLSMCQPCTRRGHSEVWDVPPACPAARSNVPLPSQRRVSRVPMAVELA
jgi:hypothetical protein